MLTNNLKHILLMQPVRVNSHIATGHRNEQEINNMMGVAFDSDMEQRNSFIIWNGVNFPVPSPNNKFLQMVVDVYANLRVLMSPNKKNIEEVFESIKSSIREEKLDSKIIGEYQEFVENNYSEFQVMVENSAKRKANLLEREHKAAEFYKNINEAELIKFILNSERGLIMDEIKLYRRTIPQNVQESINEAIKKQVFDNIYILYYDSTPSPFYMKLGNKEKIIAKEENKLKDPIAFGVIFGSDRLFFIDDWEDEYCNLKFSDITNFLGSNKTCEESDAV